MVQRSVVVGDGSHSCGGRIRGLSDDHIPFPTAEDDTKYSRKTRQRIRDIRDMSDYSMVHSFLVYWQSSTGY